MADKNNKWPDNAPGKYYVDNSCIDCDACESEAPNHFNRNAAEGHAFVAKQPTTAEEEALCQAALKGCPVEAIGDNG